MTALGSTKEVLPTFLLVMCALVIISAYTSINAVVKAELFPANIRALGVGLPYAIAVSLFGGTAETLALTFKQNHHANYFYWYVTVCILISLVVYVAMGDTRKYSKIED
jgi:MHS family alpha-ketoglutarate permease-like MFS transporter